MHSEQGKHSSRMLVDREGVVLSREGAVQRGGAFGEGAVQGGGGVVQGMVMSGEGGVLSITATNILTAPSRPHNWLWDH